MRKRPAKPAPQDVTQSVGSANQANGQLNVAGDQINYFFADGGLSRRLFGRPKPPAAREPVVRTYLTFLYDRHRFMDFRGLAFADRQAIRLELSDLYVPLKARIQMPEGETWARDLRAVGRSIPEEDRAIVGDRISEPLEVEELFTRHSGLVILGDPGSGKTTFLKHLALELASGRNNLKRFPVLAPLSAYANAMANRDEPLNRFLPCHFESECGVDIRPEFERALAAGVAVVLLDGLDEVKEAGLRLRVVRRVDSAKLISPRSPLQGSPSTFDRRGARAMEHEARPPARSSSLRSLQTNPDLHHLKRTANWSRQWGVPQCGVGEEEKRIRQWFYHFESSPLSSGVSSERR